ncbi:apolipoprotein N-acyltransferase [Ehrlichia ruminantium]|nr:apolipoprotein N-acyltransferase [Ehrlichia ruminantium]
MESFSYKKHNYTFAVVLGAMSTISMPPFYMFIALLIGFSGFYITLSHAQNTKQAFYSGWWFGFGYFTTSLYWLAVPLIAQSRIFWPLVPFAITIIPAILSLFFGMASSIVHFINCKKLYGLIVLSLSFTIAGICIEIILPWNLLAYSWSFSTEMLQTASLIGPHGMTFLAVLCSAAVGVSIQDKCILPCIITLITLVSMYIYGSNRLSNQEYKYHNDIALRIVQGNIDHRWDENEEQEYNTFQTYLGLTSKYGLNSRTHIIWGEGSFPLLTDKNNNLITNNIKFTIPKFLIASGTRYDKESQKFHNTLFAINDNGKIIDYYDKYHLVPFGEFIPSILQSIVPRSITAGFSYNSGTEQKKLISLNNNRMPFVPSICYESIFSNEMVHKCINGKWIINLTNDGWFGISSQPYQHFEMSRMRSIENGLPTIRAANTGISAIIDSYGRIIHSLPIITEGIIDSYLPYHINNGTLYSRYISKFITPLFGLIIIAILLWKIIFHRYRTIINT